MNENILKAPDAFEIVSAAIDKLGPWKRWTPGRQTWYLRKKAGLTQRALEALSGVGQHRISEIENGGDPKLSTLIELWKPLGFYPGLVPDRAGPREGLRRRTKTMSSGT